MPFSTMVQFMSGAAYHIVFNARSGSAGKLTEEQLRALFAAQGHEVSIDADDEAPLEARVRRAIESDAPVIVAAGGDGTVTALAAAILKTSKTLGVLPLGTANLLARDLRLPLDPEGWVAALDTMETRQIDVGEVNGRPFLHKVVIGTIPGIAAAREEIRDRSGIGARLAFLGHFARRLARAKRIAVEITPRDGEARVERVQSIAVGNNGYDEGVGRFFSRSCLDAGRLSVYVLKHLTLTDVLRLSAEMLMGAWRQDEALEIENVRALRIRMRRRRVRAMVDGEIMMLDTPLEFSLRPCALSILAPPPVSAEEPVPAIATQPA